MAAVPAVSTSATEPRPCSGVAEALDTDLGWALGVVFRAYVKLAGVAVDKLPGGPRGYQILAAAARSVPGTQLSIAQQLGVDRTVMTYLLDDLVGAGLIERQPDPADRRARRIVATAHGHATLAELRDRLQYAERQLLDGMPEADRAAFRELLRKLATGLDAHDPMPNPCQAVEDAALDGPPAAGRSRGRRG